MLISGQFNIILPFFISMFFISFFMEEYERNNLQATVLCRHDLF